ncbi:hypothetical protein [Brassicibacter mesophilus]|uniref:hypothetical protein n=1 Tax=Brassicibacter mesophilus TaxID=745119 RepID=UPI003D1A30FA
MNYQNYLEKVKENGLLIKEVPEKYIDKLMILTAINENKDAIDYIKVNMINEEILLEIIRQDASYMKLMPKKDRSKDFCEKAYKVNNKVKKYIPDEIRKELNI